MLPILDHLEVKQSEAPKGIFVAAFSAALIFHALLGLLFYSYDFGPKAYVVDNASYRVSLSNTVPTPNPESLIEPLSNTKDSPLTTPSEPIETETLEQRQAKADQDAKLDNERLEPVQEQAQEQVPEQDPPPVEVAEQVKPVGEQTAQPEKVLATVAKSKTQSNVSDTIEAPATTLAAKEYVDQQKLAQKAPDKQVSDAPQEAKPEAHPEETTEAERVTNEPSTEPDQTAQSAPVPQPKKEEPVEEFRSPSYEIGSPNNPRPPYPSMAARRGWEGDVVLGVYVNAEGQVTYVEILETSNISALDFAAYSTVYEEWQFSPADAHEINLRGYVRVPISFRK